MLGCGVQSEADRSKVERLSTIVARMSDSFTVMHSPVEQFEKVGDLFDKLTNASLHEAIVENLRTFANYVYALTAEPSAATDHSGQTNHQQIASGGVQSGAKTFTDTTVMNFLRILKFSCQYSHQVFMQLILSGIFEIAENVLRLEAGEEHGALISALLDFLNSLLPNTSDKPVDEIVIGPQQKLNYSDDPQSGYQRYLASRRGLEQQKLEFLRS